MYFKKMQNFLKYTFPSQQPYFQEVLQDNKSKSVNFSWFV